VQALRDEVAPLFKQLCSSEKLPKDIFVHLILVPLKRKAEFQQALHARLKGLQG
jgi:hypothetical protein